MKKKNSFSKTRSQAHLSRLPIGIVRFLGTHCDRDVGQALQLMKIPFKYLWFKDQFDYKNFSAFILPGGFSYGDYLRSGALAARTPVMASIGEAARKGYPVLGICNGFQILCEAHLLPGVLVQNKQLLYIDQWEKLELSTACPFWGSDSLKTCVLPIAHREGCYYLPKEEEKVVRERGQIWWTYQQNPNGSFFSIAGVMSEKKNVAGLMPHPERAIFPWMGGEDGLSFFDKWVMS